MLRGNIHSIETMGTLDGPGIRTIFFLQGCPLKCSYCHNPDTQAFEGGKSYTVEEIVRLAKRYKPYYKSRGGVTFSGGEALMQGAFVLAAAKALKAEGIHVALDTSGVGQIKYYRDILQYVDLVLLDIKHFTPEGYQGLTTVNIQATEGFFEALKGFEGEIWVRHVMVPGVTDDYKSMDDLCEYVDFWLDSVEKIEILPYHRLGVDKYSQLGLTYTMAGVEAMDPVQAKVFETYANDQMKTHKRIAV